MDGKRKERVFFLGKIIISTFLILYFAFTLDFRELFKCVESLSIYTWLVLCFIVISTAFLNALRWRVILGKSKYSKLLKVTFISGLYYIILPGQLIAEGTKLFLLKDDSVRKEELAISILFEKILSMLAVLLCAIIGLCMTDYLNVQNIRHVCIVILAFITLLLFFSAIFDLQTVTDIIVKKLINSGKILSRIGRIINNIIKAWNVYIHKKTIVCSAFVLSCVTQLLSVLSGFVLTNDLGIKVAFYDWMWVDAYVTILLLLPISIAGLGVRDGSLISVLGIFGVSKIQSWTVSTGQFCMQLVRALIGLVLVILDLLSNIKINRDRL